MATGHSRKPDLPQVILRVQSLDCRFAIYYSTDIIGAFMCYTGFQDGPRVLGIVCYVALLKSMANMANKAWYRYDVEGLGGTTLLRIALAN